MSILAEVPAQVMQAAAQFASSDPCKQGLTGIHLQGEPGGIRVGSTNGHFAFRCVVPFGNLTYMDQKELLVPAASFKKKVTYARKVSITGSEARFCGGKKETMDMLETRPCVQSEHTFPVGFDTLWPDPELMKNSPGSFVAFNEEYMRTICDVVAKYPESGTLRMYLNNSPATPMLLTSETEDFQLQFLLMPIQTREG